MSNFPLRHKFRKDKTTEGQRKLVKSLKTIEEIERKEISSNINEKKNIIRYVPLNLSHQNKYDLIVKKLCISLRLKTTS